MKELECELLKSQNEANNANKITIILSALKECNQELENLRNQQLNGTLIRSKARWIGEGEKPTKYFLNLEKRNFVNKQMVKMERSDGTLAFRQDEIMGEVFSFYEGLYSKQENVVDGLNSDLLNSLTCKQLTDGQSKEIGGSITMTELSESLDNMKNGKSPGPDGFTVEFFKCFWPELSHFLLRSINTAFKTGSKVPNLDILFVIGVQYHY